MAQRWNQSLTPINWAVRSMLLDLACSLIVAVRDETDVTVIIVGMSTGVQRYSIYRECSRRYLFFYADGMGKGIHLFGSIALSYGSNSRPFV